MKKDTTIPKSIMNKIKIKFVHGDVSEIAKFSEKTDYPVVRATISRAINSGKATENVLKVIKLYYKIK